MRATYLCGLLLIFAGCSTPTKTLDFSSWSQLTRLPASSEENAVTVILNETEEVESAYVPIEKSPKTVYTKACGLLIQGESTQLALNNEDADYFLKINCTTVEGATNDKGYVRFLDSSIKQGHRGWLTRWRRQAVLDSKGSRRAVPYICFSGQVTTPLCSGSKSSVAVAVNQLTSQSETVFKSWKE